MCCSCWYIEDVQYFKREYWWTVSHGNLIITLWVVVSYMNQQQEIKTVVNLHLWFSSAVATGAGLVQCSTSQASRPLHLEQDLLVFPGVGMGRKRRAHGVPPCVSSNTLLRVLWIFNAYIAYKFIICRVLCNVDFGGSTIIFWSAFHQPPVLHPAPKQGSAAPKRQSSQLDCNSKNVAAIGSSVHCYVVPRE